METATALVTVETGNALSRLAAPLPADRNPALVYIAGLAPGARRTMREALEVIAELLSCGACTAETLPWGALRFQHTAAVRSALAERYAPATANNPPGGAEKAAEPAATNSAPAKP